MWKETFTLALLLWLCNAANNNNTDPISEESYGEEYTEDEYLGEEENKPGMAIGEWWKNGKALEPKWRDGDNIPLVPFHAITSKSRHSKERLEVDVIDVSSFQSNNKKSNNFYPDNVDNKFTSSDVHLSRRRKPPQEKESARKFEPLSNNKQNLRFEQEVLHHIKEVKFPYENGQVPYKKMEVVYKNLGNKNFEVPYENLEVANKYRETFQNRPNEYELNDDEYQRPRPRKRRPPQNDEFVAEKANYPTRPEVESKTPGSVDLKTLLKKQQGSSLSLSEILQRSNLTLSDLLQGKVNVIDLLKNMKDDYAIEEAKPNKVIGHQKMEIKIREPITLVGKEVYKLLEPTVELLNNNDTNFEETKPEESGRIIPADRELVMQLNQELTNDKKVKLQESTKIVNSKILMSQKMAISENPVKLSTTMKNLDTTLPQVTKTENTEEDEIMEFSDFTVQSSTEEPVLNANEEEQVEVEVPVDSSSTTKDDTDDLPNKYEKFLSNLAPEARAEIQVLFSSGSSAMRLERLLKSRNMTLDEFVALRQRGSSQVHLAEVSKQRRQKSYMKTESSTSNFELNSNTEVSLNSELETKEPEKDTSSSISTTTSTTSKMPETSTVNEIKDSIANEQKVTNKILFSQPSSDRQREILNIYTAFDTLPFGKNLNDRNDMLIDKNNSMTFIEVGRVEEILQKDTEPFDSDEFEETIEEINRPEETPATFSRMKSSIIASGAILSVTVVVFVMIFIICRMQQKQKYTYRNTFSRAVFQSPALAARKLSNSSSLNTIMVNVISTSTLKKAEKPRALESDYDIKSDIENDSLDGNDSWDTIPDFMK